MAASIPPSLRSGAASSEQLFLFRLRVHGGKAPAAVAPKRRSGAPRRRKDWRSPRRFARFGGHWKTHQRLGLRWPSTAFDSMLSMAEPVAGRMEKFRAEGELPGDIHLKVCRAGGVRGFWDRSAAVLQTSRSSFALPGIWNNSTQRKSARRRAHSKTLREVRRPLENAPASWTAVALHRFRFNAQHGRTRCRAHGKIPGRR
jgi:hypothetical protein